MRKSLIASLAVLASATQANAIGLCWPECVETMPMDERTVAITAQGVGFFSVGQNENVLIEAAKQTLAHGYTHFRLSNPNEYTQSTPGYFGGYRSGNYINGWVGTRRYGTASAIVTMGDNGLDAQRILQQYGE